MENVYEWPHLQGFKKENRSSEYNRKTEEAKSWWRSLRATEGQSGLAWWRTNFHGLIFIKIPVPWTGEIDVIRYGRVREKSSRIRVTERQRSHLRALLRLPGSKGWQIRKTPDGVILLREIKKETRPYFPQ